MTYHPRQATSSALITRRSEIEAAVTHAVDLSCRLADRGTHRQAEEPDYVAYFFLKGLEFLEIGLNRILSQHRLQVTLSGIFCHQTPKVFPERSRLISGHRPSCELGDLLLVTLHSPPGDRTIGRRALGNALLLQAKMGATPPSVNDLQWELYSKSTSFRYKSPASLGGRQRLLGDASPALWYWSLEKLANSSRWATKAIHARSPWTPAQSFELPFSGLVWSLFAGVAGTAFYKADSPSNAGEGWSAMVNDLIKDTANRAFTRNNCYIIRGSKSLRGSEALRQISANHSTTPGFLVRASLEKSLALINGDLRKAGAMLEKNTDVARQKSGLGKTTAGNGRPPFLGRMARDGDAEGGGASFVIAHFEEL